MAKKLNDRELENLYDSGDFKLVQERSDFLLPQIVDFIRTKNWVNIRPEYQRRLVWDRSKKSKLIESLIMNVPIPPIFLYEHDLNRYEVTDGQQRLNAVVEFYENKFILTGLEHWKEINGKSYTDLPPRLQRGLDRRRISATVLMSESSSGQDKADDLRRIVFERLNTGGQSLNAQELRNCVYQGSFNNLIIELAGTRKFNEMWNIPAYDDNIRANHISKELSENRFFKRMLDCEIILRFFAFSGAQSSIKGSIRSMLDRCMKENKNSNDIDIENFRVKFHQTIDLAYTTLGKLAFCVPRIGNGVNDRYSPPLFDAVMVALHRQVNRKDEIIQAKNKIKIAISRAMKEDDFFALIVGRANTAESIKERIKEVEDRILKSL